MYMEYSGQLTRYMIENDRKITITDRKENTNTDTKKERGRENT